jgi:hypothetical protein
LPWRRWHPESMKQKAGTDTRQGQKRLYGLPARPPCEQQQKSNGPAAVHAAGARVSGLNQSRGCRADRAFTRQAVRRPMAAGDGRAFARPPRPHGVNFDSCFRWQKVPRGALPVVSASRYLGSTPPEGEKVPREACLFQQSPPTNPSFRTISTRRWCFRLRRTLASGSCRACLKLVGRGAKHSIARPSRAVKIFRLITSLPLFCSSR